MEPLTASQVKNEFVDREAIRDCMHRSCRGVDRFERRNDEWCIAHRVVVADWSENGSASINVPEGPFGMPKSTRSREDESYTGLEL